MRYFLSNKARLDVFGFLKKKHHVKNWKELSEKIQIPYKTVQNWRLGSRYIPDELLKLVPFKFNIIDQKEANWGQRKGGHSGLGISKKLKNKLQKVRMSTGKKVMRNLWKKYGSELTKKAVAGKIKKREKESKQADLKNQNFFINKKIFLDISKIKLSKFDKKKKLKLPEYMSSELAEEIGIHLGDGCLLKKRNYFSVKCNKKEESYISGFVFPLYKKIYNLDLKLMRLPSVSGFETYSQAILEFKNKVLKIPHGKKIGKITVPKCVFETRNKKIYSAFIRGIFDTDGCATIAKGRYPRILISIKSENLLEQIVDMLKKMGFIPVLNKWEICLNGHVMLDKWIREIGSSNPKKITKLKELWAISSAWIERGPAEKMQ
ncbi:hypothetical protein COV11_00505 [Candidatus Woesearchaeota archaeon CG10_big_fil_rev_8_21_14_0_10_30_7]|nr:MAG: hypothetical protein COV11_00505 [Candidatus Woesearchaeota archaeon CG10_big_fil_rev_8_21_14_0_10_30_7]